MQDCLQVVSLPRILAVKQLQELDGGEGTDGKSESERKEDETLRGSRERKTSTMTEWRSGDVWPACRLKHSPVGQTSGLCTFWQCWAGIPDSPRTGWRTRIPTGGRRRGRGRGRGRGGRMRERERERDDVKKIYNLCKKFNQACLISWVLDRTSQTQQADSKIQEKSADWRVPVGNESP